MAKGTGSWSAWAAALTFFLAGLFPLFTADAYGHLAQGRQILELGRVPQFDGFSFWKPTPQPWTNYEWLYDLVTWVVYDGLGPSALVLIKSFALGLLGYLLVVLADRLSQSAILAAPITLAALLLALPIARFRFTARPQIVGLVFPAALLLGIATLYSDGASRNKRAWTLALLGLLHVVWVNAHGSHLFGLAISFVFVVFAVRTRALRWMVGLFVVQLAATGCTPFGFSIATDAVSHVFDPRYRELVVEWGAWSPKDPLRLLVGPVVTALATLVTLRPVVRSSRYGLAYGVFCVLLSAMAFRSMRFVAHQLLFCAPFIGAGLALSPGVSERRRGVAALVGLSALTCALWMPQLVPAFGFGLGESKRAYPWASAEAIEQGIESPRVLATIEDGWFLMFAAPSAGLLVDGRVPFYGPEMIQRVAESFTDAERFAALLGEYDVNTVVIDHTRADHIPATKALASSDEWALVFVEDGHSTFARRDVLGATVPFEIVGAGYRAGRLLDPRLDEAAVAREVGRLGARENTQTIHAWHEGLVLLRPLARDGDRAGLRKHRTPEEQARARAAYARLSVAADALPGFTAIELYRAMAALAACDVEAARVALARARVTGQTRGTALLGLELSLRGGGPTERSSAIVQLERLQRQPETRDDPWLTAIARDIETRCSMP